MSIITAAVFASTYWNGVGFFKFDKIPYRVKAVLKDVSKKQRHKYRKFGVVPVPVLEAFWLMEFLPGDKEPAKGMELFNLAEFLRQGEYRDQQHLENAKWLYNEIINKEVIAFNGKRKTKVPKS